MSDINVFGWDNKFRTRMKSIKVGDIFFFALSEQGYVAGRVMTKNSLGHVVEVFDGVVEHPLVKELSFKRRGHPIIIDSYSLFDRKAEGDWRIVAHEIGYEPSRDEVIRFVYGVGSDRKLVDVFDNESQLGGDEGGYPLYSPMGDEDVKELFRFY